MNGIQRACRLVHELVQVLLRGAFSVKVRGRTNGGGIGRVVSPCLTARRARSGGASTRRWELSRRTRPTGLLSPTLPPVRRRSPASGTASTLEVERPPVQSGGCDRLRAAC